MHLSIAKGQDEIFQEILLCMLISGFNKYIAKEFILTDVMHADKINMF